MLPAVVTPVVSINICTRNRAVFLKPTLDAMRGLDVPADLPAELIIVDNASTDDTRRVVEEARLANLDVRYILEPRPGKSICLNRALAESRGQYLLFTDDDVRVPPGWISGMTVPLVNGAADAVQGGIRLPPHLRVGGDAERQRFTELLPESNPQTNETFLVGANMAIRRSVLDRVPGFDEQLGPGQLGFGDDVLFALQLVEAGFKIAMCLDVAVEHHFDPGRLSRSFVLEENGKRGASSAYISHHWAHLSYRWLRLKLLWQLAKLAAVQTFGRDRHRAAGIGARENAYSTQVGFYRQILLERSKPRAYDRCGLVKRSAVA